MAGNLFGTIFRISTFGESHGKGIGVVIDGCPAGLTIDEAFIQAELEMRKPGQSKIVTQRKESDEFEILSGVFEGKSTGTPISIFIPNQNQKSRDYDHIKDKFRPSHADFTYDKKYGNRDYRGGGRSSARETAARVAAGAIAKLLLQEKGISIFAYVDQVGPYKMSNLINDIAFEAREANPVRCPDTNDAEKMEALIMDIRKAGDTIGGAIRCIVKGTPVGLGEPVFDKLHADLGKAMLSINAVKGFEYGSGFAGVSMKGTDKVSTQSNYSGGIQGGISNGMDIYFRVAFKPVATIMQDQGKGRHDPCVVPRAVPIVEAMAALVLVDHLLRSTSDRMDQLV
ncbi:UNVERIFIED_CONTAM: hypothetical protein GTU68_031774 [Idotea baltica]|nr:hypothetical protein [Idotea baltica]